MRAQSHTHTDTHMQITRMADSVNKYPRVPTCFTLWQKSMTLCMRSKAWLAASVWLRLARRHLQATCGAHVICAARLQLRQVVEGMHTLFSDWVQNLGTQR